MCKLMKEDKPQVFNSDLSIREVIGITVCFLFPFTFNWIPFTNGYYGLSGHWCWIKLTENDTVTYGDNYGVCGHRDIAIGVSYMFVMYYGPLMVILLTTSIISTMAILVWCKNTKTDSIKEVAILMVYPIIFDVLCSIIITNRIVSVKRANNGNLPFNGLWMAHSIADPARTLLPAVFFLLQLLSRSTREMVTKTRHSEERMGEKAALMQQIVKTKSRSDSDYKGDDSSV